MKLGNVIIFGDSYSTYEGYIPKGYAPYYTGHRDATPDLFDVKDTWWGRLIDSTDSTLVQNNSWSGSTIGYTGYNNSDASHSSSFIYRFEKLLSEGFFEQNRIDTLFVFGGTNDSWSNAPLGELKYGDISEKDRYCVLPAISHFAERLKETFPDARIVFIINCGIKDEIIEATKQICGRYALEYVALSDIDKDHAHPTELGMKQICDQILDGIR